MAAGPLGGGALEVGAVKGLVRWLLDPGGLTPHGFCLLWNPGLLWTHALSDLLTGAAYAGISLALAIIVNRRPDLISSPSGFPPTAFRPS